MSNGDAAATFLNLVLNMNPSLRFDDRVSVKMVSRLLSTFELEIKDKKIIDYDWLLETVAGALQLPARVVEPFVEMYATAYVAINGRKFTKMCYSCRRSHNLDEIQQCGMRDSSVVKTAIGLVVVDDNENISSVKN